MLRDGDRKDLTALEVGHFKDAAKIIRDSDSVLAYGAKIDMQQYANAGFALLEPTKPENTKLIVQTLQDQQRKLLYVIEQYEKSNDAMMSWLRWASVWLVHKEDQKQVAQIAK